MAGVVVQLGAQSGLIVPLIAVHLFVFYFGIMADSTPPVALAAFAAAAISGGDPVKTGVQAFQYELRTALLAYMMFFNPQLLLIAHDRLGGLPLAEAIPMILFAFIGLVAFSAATLRFLHRKTNPVQMLMLLVAAFAGEDRIRAAYDAALSQDYRFYSLGDAMLLERLTSA